MLTVTTKEGGYAVTKVSQAFGAPKKRATADDADDLQLSMRTTANCRHNASVRLLWQSSLTFNATALLSLALIFIPLMQNSGVRVEFKDGVLNMMQVFLGVAVLVYSLIIGTARYEVRALQLAQCADSIKELIRDMKMERLSNGGTLSVASLVSVQDRYAEILTSSENHIENDYRLAMLYMQKDYEVYLGTRALMHLKAIGNKFAAITAPAILVFLVLFFTSEMFGLSSVTAHHLPSWHRAG
jgi:hypothetical protein